MAKKKPRKGWIRWDEEYDSPLSVVAKWIENMREYGCICPACGQQAMNYHRVLNSGQADSLIRLYLAGGDKEYIHVRKRVKGRAISFGGDMAKLRYWGLIKMGDKRGWWMLTQKGIDFVQARIHVQEKVIIYNDEFLGYEKNNKWVDVYTALGTKFDYDKLMGNTD
jgi:hypothetical protein